MGRSSAEGMVEYAGVNRMTIEWHLTSNHYPPVSTVWVAPALTAISRFEAGDDTKVETPDGFKGPLFPSEIVEGLHLWEFVEVEE